MSNIKEYIIESLNNLYASLNTEELNKHSFFDDFLKSLEQTIQNISSDLNAYNAIINDVSRSRELINSQTKNDLDEINKKHELTINLAETNSRISINKLRKEISDYTANTDNLYVSTKSEKLLITSSTNPYIYSDLIQRNSNIELLNTHKKEITDRYNALVDKLTCEKNQANNLAISNNNRSMHEYLEASSSIIASMENKLKDINVKLNTIDVHLNNLKVNFDKNCLEIEKNFNSEVRLNNKNMLLKKEELKRQYEADKQAAHDAKAISIEKGMNTRSSAMKEFAQEIAKLNDKLDMLKNNQAVHIKENTNIFELNIFDIKRKIRDIQTACIDDPIKAKEYKPKIKALMLEKKIENQALKKKLKTINKSYSNKFSSINHEKDIQERIKNDLINKVEQVNIIDDNTYHNKLEILQRQYEYDVEELNRQTNFYAKKLRSAFDEMKLEVMKEYKIKQTQAFKRRQALVHESDIILHEIKMSKMLEDQVNKTNKLEMDNLISRSSIDTLLEIEKNDILNEYHIDRINKLIDLEKEKFLYNEALHFSERDRKHEVLDINVKRAGIDLDHNRIIYGHEIDMIVSKEQYERSLEETAFSEKNGIIKATYSKAHFSNMKKTIIAVYDISLKIFNYIETLINSLSFKIQLTRISSTEGNDLYLINLLKTVVISCNKTLTDLLSHAKEAVLSAVNEQINLETGDKYNQLLEGLERQYRADIHEFNDREDSIADTIDNYNVGVKKFYSNISSIDLKLRALTRKFNTNQISKSTFAKESAALKDEKKRQLVLINKNEDNLDHFKAKYEKMPKEKDKITKDYEKKKAAILKKKQDEASILYDSIEELTSYFERFSRYLKETAKIVEAPYTNSKTFIMKSTSSLKKELSHIFSHTTDFLTIINTLDQAYSSRYDKLLKQSKASYDMQIQSINKRYSEKNEKISSSITAENEQYSSKVKDNTAVLNSIVDRYKKNDDSIKDKYEAYNNMVDDYLDDIYQNFYTKTSAIKLSLLNNIKKSKDKSSYIITKNNETNKSLILKYNNEKNDLISLNKKALNDYTEAVNYIPSEFKIQVKELRNQFLEYEKEFNNNEKNLALEFKKQISEKNRGALRYSDEIHSKIIKINNSLSKARKALTQLG